MCNQLTATKLVEAPGFFVRLIPTATSLFSNQKLNLQRNNVRALNHGIVFSSSSIFFSGCMVTFKKYADQISKHS